MPEIRHPVRHQFHDVLRANEQQVEVGVPYLHREGTRGLLEGEPRFAKQRAGSDPSCGPCWVRPGAWSRQPLADLLSIGRATSRYPPVPWRRHSLTRPMVVVDTPVRSETSR